MVSTDLMNEICKNIIRKCDIIHVNGFLKGLFVIVIVNCQMSIVNSVSAQTFLDDLRQDKAGQGKVTVTQSKEIDELVNGKANVNASPTPTPNVVKDLKDPKDSKNRRKPKGSKSTAKPQPTPAKQPLRSTGQKVPQLYAD